MPTPKQKNKGGRPKKWESVDEFTLLTLDYFETCIKARVKPTKSGLALALDTNKETLSDYNKKDGFSDAIKRAYTFIEEAWVQRLDGQAATGAIFYLKNAFAKDYRDRTETDVTTKGEKITAFNLIPPNGSEHKANG